MDSRSQKGILLSVLLIGSSTIFTSTEVKKSSEVVKSNIKGISGSIPIKLHEFIEDLEELPIDTKIDNGFCNRLVFNGPPGNGKSTFAYKIAEATKNKSELKIIAGGSIVGSYTGEGSQKIEEIFKEALNITIEQKKRVVICIDEADVIAIKPDTNNAGYLQAYTSTLKTLLTCLDSVKDNPLIVFVATTNHIERFDKPLIDRFEDNIIKINNPNGEMRKEVINFYINEINLKHKKNFKLEEKELLTLIKQTKGISIRGIRGAVYRLYRNKISDRIVDISKVVEEYKEKPAVSTPFTRGEKIAITGIIVGIGTSMFNRSVPQSPATTSQSSSPAS